MPHACFRVHIQGRRLLKRWRPPFNLRVALWPIGALLAFGGSAGLAFLLVRLLSQNAAAPPAGLSLFALALGALVLLVLAIAFAARAIHLLTLRFTVERDAVVASWRGGRCVIPLSALAAGEGEDASLPEIRFGLGNRDQLVVLQTRRARYALAVAETDAFIADVAARIALGAVRPQPEGFQLEYARLRAFAADPIARWTFGLGAAITALLWALISWRYAGLAETIVVRFDPLGGPAGTRGRSYTLLLLGASTAAIAANGVFSAVLHERSAAASQLLLLAAVLLQMLIGVALLFIIFR